MADILLYNAIAKSSHKLRVAVGEPTFEQLFSNPNCFAVAATVIPKLTTANALCVYDSASGYFRCGGCCLWTVPANTTKVRFELWGAGAGTGAGNCCSHSPWGANGAYASVIIDAVPGCQYTLCAGCAHAHQIYCTQTCDVSGCQSFVTGFGLTNFCADGGCHSLARNMLMLHGQTCCRYQAKGNTVAGGCICGANADHICNGNGCASCGIITRVYDTNKKGYGTATTGTVYQFPSTYASDCYDTNFYGCHCSTPTILPNGNVSTPCCGGYTSGTCCGYVRSACNSVLCNPGQGGSFTHVMGGNTENYGDWGRTGMVKVSWC